MGLRLTLPNRRRVIAAACVGTLSILGGALWAQAPGSTSTPSPAPTSASPAAASATGDPSLIERGQQLFGDNCASCHGTGGVGTSFGPSLIGVGAAAADFMLRTGRMPLADPTEQAIRKPPAFTPSEIKALVAYVGSLGHGPAIPTFSLRNASLSEGQDLFTINCAPCHGITAAGDAIGGPAFAPSLHQSSPLDVEEAVRIGPGQMPNFSTVLTDAQIDDIARYVQYSHDIAHPGGANLGWMGPVPEGYIAWFIGSAAIVVILILFVARSHGSAGPSEEH